MNCTIRFVFKTTDDDVKQPILDFWAKNRPNFRSELISFRSAPSPESAKKNLPNQTLSTNVASIATNENGKVVGIVFVALRRLEAEWNLGSHAYFQRMYVVPAYRNAKIANQLFTTFLLRFEAAITYRDCRASYLLSENVNPALHSRSMRRYFARHGFRMLGINQSGSEIWVKKLETRFVF